MENTHLLANTEGQDAPRVSVLIDPKRYSSAYRLFKVTALVLRFVHSLHKIISPTTHLRHMSELEQAKFHWIRDCQSQLLTDSKFMVWKRQLDLCEDEFGIWRCGGRMLKSSLSLSAKNPVLLDWNHFLTNLIVFDAHLRVLHNGVKETLAEFRSEYWLIKGRQFVRKLINHCTVCKKQDGRPCHGNPPPPLPDYHVRRSRPFQTTGVDFASPLYVNAAETSNTAKVWLCQYTCCATRAVHGFGHTHDCRHLSQELQTFCG